MKNELMTFIMLICTLQSIFLVFLLGKFIKKYREEIDILKIEQQIARSGK